LALASIALSIGLCAAAMRLPAAEPGAVESDGLAQLTRALAAMEAKECATSPYLLPLIEELAEHATQERFVYYHRWRVGDVLIWDERATMHRGAGDYRPDERRIMLRTIVYLN